MKRPVLFTSVLLVVATAGMYAIDPGREVVRVPRPDPDMLATVVASVEELDALRSELAASFEGEPDASTFARVCKPVGARSQELADEHGWKVRQLALKNRNPANTLDPDAELVYRMMDATPDIMGLWVWAEREGQEGFRYYRRIVVERSCLACHGAKEERPAFIKEGYPDDRAYGFRPGDLRGVYSVFVPAERETPHSE
ncbi:MAG: DUF3365 domain-containing protein [Gemmatimonadetes bacterium]|uniref:DUF3365 domain-containing protein n=1 Tax=Candidatus Kutchimonas denitrificans TaxID=3056748 RepID=A0AAE4Z6S0_9BACT|nr:DUF3365 domain-containing protein [Gemmatimonadota bacterium]NIR74795.1 DUF3365 domain-containing protein [Candidatus Kutchimonas denitrificans]NIR99906.1 DUF3365 domain-containing protein [Gemmatimonadota bacterium]NIT65490.1 DUF3365 domain-containing protein [Gemmatimonadota bacterium]NIU52460.1 DUF3365 domain-containing protein [Gemmatimonadota bacterium]